MKIMKGIKITVCASLLLLTACAKIGENDMPHIEKVLVQDDNYISLIDKAFRDMAEFCPVTKSSAEAFCNYYIDKNCDTLALVVQFNSGYAVYSNNSGNDLLVLSPMGNFVSDMEHIEFSQVLEGVANSVKESDFTPRLPDLPITLRYPVTDTTSYSVTPMIEVHWNQYEPFNWYAENEVKKLAGCTMVAIAQVMSYYEYPKSISLTYDGAEVSVTDLNWAMMKKHCSSGHERTCVYCKQNARLLRQIGEICEADYDTTSTGAWPRVEYLNALGYTGVQFDSFSFSSVKYSLDNGRPCIISGFKTPEIEAPGHTWNLDGYKSITYLTTTYEQEGNSLPREIAKEERIDTYLHFNYGWGGSRDAYFLSQRHEKGEGLTIMNGYYEETTISIFNSGRYDDIRMLVTNVRPIE
ncbi:MAG: C10 family peptidase [Bacteroidales bacterium]|nr:C10 family peptidase [Bacteroidales bacterium]